MVYLVRWQEEEVPRFCQRISKMNRKRVNEMGLATFKGGVHPYEGKELSENQPIEVLMPKGSWCIRYPSTSVRLRSHW